MELTLIQLGMVATLIAVAAITMAWLRRQSDPLAARYRLSAINVLFVGGVFGGLWIAHWTLPKTFEAPRFAPLGPMLPLVLGVHYQLGRKLARKG